MNHAVYKKKPLSHYLLHKAYQPTIILGWLSLCVLSYFYLDRPIATLIHQHPSTWLLTTAEYITKLGYSGWYLIVLPLLALGLQFILKKKSLANQAWFVFVSVAASGLLCDLLKILVGRSRPIAFFHDHIYGLHFLQFHYRMWSFPSGHISVLSALSFAIAYCYPKTFLPLFSVTFVVAITRVLLGAHFCTDVLGGMYLGCVVVSLLVIKLRTQSYFYRPVA